PESPGGGVTSMAPVTKPPRHARDGRRVAQGIDDRRAANDALDPASDVAAVRIRTAAGGRTEHLQPDGRYCTYPSSSRKIGEERMSSTAKAARRYANYVNGSDCAGREGATFESINPTTGAAFGQFVESNAGDVDVAVRAAHA